MEKNILRKNKPLPFINCILSRFGCGYEERVIENIFLCLFVASIAITTDFLIRPAEPEPIKKELKKNQLPRFVIEKKAEPTLIKAIENYINSLSLEEKNLIDTFKKAKEYPFHTELGRLEYWFNRPNRELTPKVALDTIKQYTGFSSNIDIFLGTLSKVGKRNTINIEFLLREKKSSLLDMYKKRVYKNHSYKYKNELADCFGEFIGLKGNQTISSVFQKTFSKKNDSGVIVFTYNNVSDEEFYKIKEKMDELGVAIVSREAKIEPTFPKNSTHKLKETTVSPMTVVVTPDFLYSIKEILSEEKIKMSLKKLSTAVTNSRGK